MEFARCKIVAAEMDDPRCAGALNAVSIETEDSRCMYLTEGRMLEVDDAHSRSVTIAVEDPRCRSLYSKW
jgi:hypothetical protein